MFFLMFIVGFSFLCIIFIGLTVWATIYENSLKIKRQMDDENISPLHEAIHPIQITKTAKSSNGQHCSSYGNATIDLESTELAINMDIIHANNIINGCTFELHPISIERNNGNHLTNNDRTAFYRLNNNNANNINNNHHSGNNDIMNDNNRSKRIQHSRNGSTYALEAMNTREAKHLSELFLLCIQIVFLFLQK